MRIEPATVPYQANAHPIELPRPAAKHIIEGMDS